MNWTYISLGFCANIEFSSRKLLLNKHVFDKNSMPSKQNKQSQSISKTPKTISSSGDIEVVVKACLSHAKDLLRASKKILKDLSLPNIAYHLAALSIEESGKAGILSTLDFGKRYKEKESSLLVKYKDDHVKKLFWALWTPLVARQEITKKQVDELQGLARNIHENRLRGLYVSTSPADFIDPKKAVSKEQTQNLIFLAEFQIKIQKREIPKNITKKRKERIHWFLSVTEDPELSPIVFGKASMEKLVKLGSVDKWITWLKKEFKNKKKAELALREKEINRSRPSEKDESKIKWKIRIKVMTNTHSVRPKVFGAWNKSDQWIKLFASQKKGEFFVDFDLPKKISAQELWPLGWGVARKFIVSLNIASFGFFWWYTPQHTSKYYESISDLENPNFEVRLERKPKLETTWEQKVLLEGDLNRMAISLSRLPNSEKEMKPFEHYLTGLAFLSKNDIHFQFEHNAFREFYHSLKEGMAFYGDWNDDETILKIFNKHFSEILRNKEEKNQLIAFCKCIDSSKTPKRPINLEDAFSMKVICDFYYNNTFKKMVEAS